MNISPKINPKAAINNEESSKHLYWKLLYYFTLEQPEYVVVMNTKVSS